MEIKKLHCLIVAIVAIVSFSFVSCENENQIDTPSSVSEVNDLYSGQIQTKARSNWHFYPQWYIDRHIISNTSKTFSINGNDVIISVINICDQDLTFEIIAGNYAENFTLSRNENYSNTFDSMGASTVVIRVTPSRPGRAEAFVNVAYEL